ncbi:MAG: GNAT family N-acetyltransferase [Anaerolineae bacterium]
MTHQIVLRDAKSADVSIITAAIRAAFEEYRGKLNPPSGSHDEREEDIGAKLRKGGGLLAYVEQQLAGVVLYYPHSTDSSLYLGRLGVLPGYRRFGVGKALVQAVETRARQLGYAEVTLGVRLQLAGNRQFFERLGYTVSSYGSHEGFTEPTFTLMSKAL